MSTSEDIGICRGCGGHHWERTSEEDAWTCNSCGDEQDLGPESLRTCGHCSNMEKQPDIFSWWECVICWLRNEDGPIAAANATAEPQTA